MGGTEGLKGIEEVWRAGMDEIVGELDRLIAVSGTGDEFGTIVPGLWDILDLYVEMMPEAFGM